METHTTLVPFHGDTITCIETPEGIFVAIKPICERLGISERVQRRKLMGDKRRWGADLMVLPSAGGHQETCCIPLSKVSAWLFSISASKVNPELREAVEQYQDEASEVLDHHFRLRMAKQDARIAELKRQLWHSQEHLKMLNPKWQRVFTLKEMGASPMMIAKRCGWTQTQLEQEQAMMRDCGMRPKWRQDMRLDADRSAIATQPRLV